MNSFRKNSIFLSAFIAAIFFAQHSHAQQTPLDKSLAPGEESDFGNVFKDMGVVQRKAMKKSGKFLLSNYGALDFSDGPYSIYAFNLNPGYAITDFLEVYVNFVPFFISNKRGIVKAIENLRLDPTYPDYVAGCTGGPSAECVANVNFIKPKMQVGLELLWAPAYGKDSVGSRNVVRSDTFFKAGVMQILYAGSQKGLKFHGGIGKSYFLDDWMGFRFAATGNFIQTYSSFGTSGTPTKAFHFFAIVEAGIVFYL